MKKITTTEACTGAKGRLISENAAEQIEAVVIDSRQAKKGSLFVAVRGERQDGHSYARAAAQQGCRAFLLSREDVIEELKAACPDADIIAVKDTVRALQELSAWYLSQFHLIKVAVTGSTGKTSTKEMTAAVLSRRLKTIKTEGNFNNELGLPLTVFQVDETTEAAVFEMGMSSLGEIHLLADIVRPDLAVITNVGTSHIEFLKTRENIQRAKLEVTDFFDKKNVLIVNSDNDYLSLSAISRCVSARRREDPEYRGSFQLVSAGEVGKQDIGLSHIDDLGEEGLTFTLSWKGKAQEFYLPLPGRHNAHNAMLAVGVGLQCGISLEEAAQALRFMEATSRRLVIETAGEYKLIDDSYNSSPDSVKAAVDVLKQVKGGRRVAVLADILELGEHSQRLHRQVGREALEGGVELLIACGAQAAFMAEEGKRWLSQRGESPENIKKRVIYFETKEKLEERLFTILKPGDIVLVKGSNGMKMAQIAEQIRHKKKNAGETSMEEYKR